MQEVIKFDQVFFSYDTIPVLINVSLAIQEGEFIGIIGPNGGGKTTALKLMLDFLSPDRGSVKIFGSDPKTMWENVGYVPQMMDFDEQFPISVLEVVLMGSLSKASWWGHFPKREIENAHQTLKTVGLYEFKDRPFGSLSGGQKQRALIGRALISHPKLLLLDEPTANVDPHVQKDIYELLKTLKKSMTILLVSHDFEMLIKHVDRILCFQKEVSSLLPTQVCEHFALGLYHPPLGGKNEP